MKASLFVVSLVTLSAVGSARAEEASKSDKDVARDIARKGAEYYDGGDFERAREHFHRAYGVVRAPTLALMEARSLVKLGRLAEATAAYSKAVTANDEGNETFRRATSEARTELTALSPKVPSIRAAFSGNEPRPIVRVDGYPLVGATPVPLNPGTHVITISQPGMADSWQSVTLGEGEQRTITFAAAAQDRAATPTEPSSALTPLMWTAFGIGGAGIAAGLVTGAVALSKKSDLDASCNGPACPPGFEDDLADYRHFRTASIVSYIVGVAGIAGGAVILATKPKASPVAAQLRATVSYGGPNVVLEGAF
jgi:hypothetical protein